MRLLFLLRLLDPRALPFALGHVGFDAVAQLRVGYPAQGPLHPLDRLLLGAGGVLQLAEPPRWSLPGGPPRRCPALLRPPPRGAGPARPRSGRRSSAPPRRLSRAPPADSAASARRRRAGPPSRRCAAARCRPPVRPTARATAPGRRHGRALSGPRASGRVMAATAHPLSAPASSSRARRWRTRASLAAVSPSEKACRGAAPSEGSCNGCGPPPFSACQAQGSSRKASPVSAAAEASGRNRPRRPQPNASPSVDPHRRADGPGDAASSQDQEHGATHRLRDDRGRTYCRLLLDRAAAERCAFVRAPSAHAGVLRRLRRGRLPRHGLGHAGRAWRPGERGSSSFRTRRTTRAARCRAPAALRRALSNGESGDA